MALSPRQLNRAFTSAKHMAGISKPATLHTLRQGFARHQHPLTADCFAIACGALDGFHGIGHYELLASRTRNANLTKIPALLCLQPPDQADIQDTIPDITPLTLREPGPRCGGPMRIIENFRRGQRPMSRAPPREKAA